ncbi:hypothetical protein ABC418_08495 [Lactiplantibacillus plantarum]|uniref:hypothetical protein n=1 Tax=Lactiplantibacillus plantarum TaxID=1590 RepID=UPI000977E607|nr:hypothetical protein [Lactiplantibacillus plantarum]
MNKIMAPVAIILSGVALAGCSSSKSNNSSNSSSDLNKETTSQLNKRYTSKIAEHAQEGKLTHDERLILNAHEKVESKQIDKPKAKFSGKTAVFPGRGTVEITKVAKVPTYKDEKQTTKKATVVITKITNTSNKTQSTDNIQVGNMVKANLGLTAYQNTDTTKENLSDDHELSDENELYNDTNSNLTSKDLSFKKVSILPHKSVTVLYEAFYLVNNKNPLTFKIQDGTGQSNSSDVLESKSTLKIPMSDVSESTLQSLLN